jgi:hypothetical protein
MLRLDLLSKHYQQHFAEKQAPIILEQEKIKEIVFKNPFLTSEEIFLDVLPSVASDEFYALSYIGGQGKGKTFSANVFATLAEQAGYLVIYGKAEDILDHMDYWVEKVIELIRKHGSPEVCFVLDDMSYSTGMISSKKAAAFKHFVADIRHVFEPVLGKIKIFMIYISHRYHSVPPMLRTSASWIFASMLPEDRADALKLIPKQKEELEKLDRLYSFLYDISTRGPREPELELEDSNGTTIHFKWGRKGDPGDGRLYLIFHAGVMRLFNPKMIDNMIDLESKRILYVPPPEQTEEEIKEAKKKKKQELKEKAEKLFPKPAEEIKALVLVKDISK